MARIALVTGCFPKDPLREVLAKGSRAGFRHFETWHLDAFHCGDLKLSSPSAAPDGRPEAAQVAVCAQRIREASRASGVTTTVIGGFNDFIQSTADAVDREVAKVIAYIDLAAELGVKVVRVMGGEPKYDVPITACVDLMLEGYRQCAPHAERKGVRLAIENHGYITNNAPLVLEMIDRIGSDAVRCCLDASNYRWAGYPLKKVYEYYRLIAPYTAYAHLKNGDGRTGATSSYTATTLDAGEMDLRVYVKTLVDAGFDGEWGIEYEGEGDPLEAQVRNMRCAAAEGARLPPRMSNGPHGITCKLSSRSSASRSV